MYRRIALLHLRPDAAPNDVKTLEHELTDTPSRVPAVARTHLGRHLEGTVGGGHYTWDLLFNDRDSCPPFAEQLALGGQTDIVDRCVERIDAVQFAPAYGHIAEPGIADCVKRTLFIEVNRTTPAERVAKFDRVLTGMPGYIATIRNWAYSRVDRDGTVGPRRWTHVWEQEYAELSGLRGEYMMNPYHWGYVDGWFDPESPNRVVEPGVAHVFCPATSSILAWAGDLTADLTAAR